MKVRILKGSATPMELVTLTGHKHSYELLKIIYLCTMYYVHYHFKGCVVGRC